MLSHLLLLSDAVFYTAIDYKGQLISKCPFGVIVWTKILTKNLTISTLESEKWSNQQNKGTYDTIIDL